ncbi:sensor histidine kinase [Clostridium sp.]|uniref:sensor histidine kinase n=1 Tax=Clostridium sp. TaxID=1506 RepID=UPI002638CE2A|nr:sensor histidine kinase [uncultured Clostridium sp.]
MFKSLFNKHIINNISVRDKLMLIYLLCVFIPVVLTNIIFINITSNNIKKQQIVQIKASLDRTKDQLYKNLNDVTVVGFTIISDDKIKEALDKQYPSIEAFYDIYSDFLKDALMRKNYLANQISEVEIYTRNKSVLNSSEFVQINDEVMKNYWYRVVTSNPYKFHYGYFKENGEWKFSLMKVLSDYGDGDYNSILKINIDDSVIMDSLKSEKLTGEVYLVNGKNQILYTTDNKYIKNNNVLPVYNSKLLKDNQYEFKTNLDKYSDLKNWHVISVINKSYISDAIQGSKKFILYMAFIDLLFALIVTYIIAFSFTNRLRILSIHIKKVRKQKYEIIDCNEGGDEIGGVIREFNYMTIKIQELITDVYEVNIQNKGIEIERRKAEIKALQSQINPHFLFNVLESIRMRSVIKKEVETAQIIKYVAKLFRRLLEWGDDMIPAKVEMDYIEDFLKIEKYRFGDKIEYEIIINEKVLDIMIPKMILQPLVENACIHGIEGKKYGGKLTVSLEYTNGNIICKIIDTGTGIKKEKLKDIVESLEQEHEGRKNIGISNVYNRLKLIYGNDFDFKINSIWGQGTKIIMRIPSKVNVRNQR